MEINLDIWDNFEAEQSQLGSSGLFDPRWHPSILIRARGVTIDNNQADYFVSALIPQPALYYKRTKDIL